MLKRIDRGGIDDGKAAIDGGVRRKGAERPPQHRLAEEMTVLLGSHAAGAFAAAGSNDDRRRAHHDFSSRRMAVNARPPNVNQAVSCARCIATKSLRSLCD